MSTPRPLGWPLLVGSGLAILIVGLVYTAFLLSGLGWRAEHVPLQFWAWAVAGAGLTAASVSLRAWRWTFLLRRTGVRIPISDSFIGYHAGLSLLFAPFLLGEMAVRAFVHRARAAVPIATTCVVNLWERYLDLVALALIGAAAAVMLGGRPWGLAAIVVSSFAGSFRRAIMRASVMAVELVTVRVLRVPGRIDRSNLDWLTSARSWAVGLTTSVGAWALPCAAFWALAYSWRQDLSPVQAAYAYAGAGVAGGMVLAPGGILVVGTRLLDYLGGQGFSEMEAAATVLTTRVTTAGLATALGLIFLWAHFRSRQPAAASHFDELAPAYEAQIPEARRRALLATKTARMERVLRERRCGPRGLDAGCGQGWYVARMRERGFDVRGLDESEGQVEQARRLLNDPALVARGSILRIPAGTGTYDFVYCINVVHHLPSLADQRAAFAEFHRVLRPGGLLFVHEINCRNLLFRFYMGYVFPLVNCIDEGIERWVPPHELSAYSPSPAVEIEYFTFLPEFLPPVGVRLLSPVERWLERSFLRRYSAHYMAVFEKP